MNLKDVYLGFLKLYIDSGIENGSLFRSFVDSWYAYSKGGRFLTNTGNPRWFNNPHPMKEREALLKMDYISKSAMEIIKQRHAGRLVKDHAIPIKILRILIHEKLKSQSTISELDGFLKKYYCLGVITKEEDQCLNRNGLKSNMPEDWSCSDDVFARYKKVKIEDAIQGNSNV